jgi:hypothetical protein
VFEVLEIAAQLFERKSESKQTLYGVARQIGRYISRVFFDISQNIRAAMP